MRMNKKTIISICLCIAACFMAVGYSILMTDLKIIGGANITSTWDVRIESISNSKVLGSAYDLEKPTFTQNTAKFKVVLINPGDTMTYKITIKNYGTLTAVLNSMNITTSGSDAIIYEVSGIKDGDTLEAGQSVVVEVEAKYNPNVIVDPYENMKTLKVGLEWIQYTNQNIPAKTYLVNYDANGGSGTMEGTICTVGQDCQLAPNNFTNGAAALMGWATSPTGALVYNDRQSVMNLTSSGKSITLYAVWNFNSLGQIILVNNGALSDDNIDFSAISSDTNGKGLYYTNKNTEDGKTTYYFRGAVDNNYVKFGQQTTIVPSACTYNGVSIGAQEWSTLDSEYGEYDTWYDSNQISKADCEKYYVCDTSWYDEESGEEYNSYNLIIGPSSWSYGDYETACSYYDGYIPEGSAKGTYKEQEVIKDDMYWRIVRINEDNSIRLVYVGISPSAYVGIGLSNFNYARSDNKYVGYMYGTSGSGTYETTHANTNNSKVKTTIDTWYEEQLKTNYSSYLADAGFCNDRSLYGGTGIGTTSSYYGAYGRLYVNNKPQFACPNPTNDLFTTSTSTKGNKALKYPIGMLTADEVAYAGAVSGTGNKSFYLFIGGSPLVTMTPYSGGSSSNISSLTNLGWLSNQYTNNGSYIRPVVNLKATVEHTLNGTGDPGTASNPYVIVTN